MTTAKNPLLNPSACGLELMAQLDIGLADEFDVVCVWRHALTNIWYIAGDAGTDREPFHQFEADDFVAVFTIDDVGQFARGWWDDQPEEKREQAVEALTSLVRGSWRKAGVR